MVSTSQPPSKDQRRSPRFRHQLQVELHEKQRTRKLAAIDVGRHGLLIATADPPQERHLVQLTIHLPDGPIKAAASVMRVLKKGTRVEGAGVEFFALSGDAKQRWDEFIFQLHRSTAPGAPASSSPAPELTDSVPMHTPASVRPAVNEREVAGGATFLVKLKSVDRLRDFAQVHLAAGGTVLFTPVLRAAGDVVTLVVVHPGTDEEFRLPGIVFKAHADRPKRLDIHFHGITPAIVETFRAFIETGKPPAVQLEAPRPLPEFDIEEAEATSSPTPNPDLDLDLDLSAFDEPPTSSATHQWRAPGDITTLYTRPDLSLILPPLPVATDPGLKPAPFLLRCDREGSGCMAEPYAVDFGPSRGVLGLIANHGAWISTESGRVISALRLASPAERETRRLAFLEKGGKLDSGVEVSVLLAVADLAAVRVEDEVESLPGCKRTRAVERLEEAALRLRDGDPPAETRVSCAACRDGRLTVERAST